VASCGVKLQLTAPFDNEQCIYVASFIILERRHVHNMDVYLQPLIDELQLLWTQGFLMIDVSKPTIDQLLILNVILLWTLHDYLGLGVMSCISSSCTF
jgi:hypothetical protein